MRGGKPKRVSPFSNSAWITWTTLATVPVRSGAFWSSFRIASCWPPAGAQAVDIEIETAETAGERVNLFHGRASLVISYHNYESTPPMDTVVNRVMRIQADAYKVVTTARKPSDNS